MNADCGHPAAAAPLADALFAELAEALARLAATGEETVIDLTATGDGLEYFSKYGEGHAFAMMKGMVFADRLNAVSEGNLREARIPRNGGVAEGFAEIINRMSAEGRTTAVFNGTDAFSPLKPEMPIEEKIRIKRQAKKQLLEVLSRYRPAGAPEIFEDHLLVSMVSRPVGQKGLDYLEAIVPRLAGPEFNGPNGQKVHLVVMTKPKNADDREGHQIAGMLKRLQSQYPQHLTLIEEFDENLANQVYAGGDAFFMPSRYEPAGIAQQIAALNGNFVIAPLTGGLTDFFHKWGGIGYGYEPHRPVDGALEAFWHTSRIYWGLQTDKFGNDWSHLVDLATKYRASWSERVAIYQKDVYGKALERVRGDAGARLSSPLHPFSVEAGGLRAVVPRSANVCVHRQSGRRVSDGRRFFKSAG